ncbi:MAG: hypothetical protein PHF67_02055 [Candidatus Nanoarchaeia archaeon]|nr:hypothetical protein [Candidatus Nanoarchaeia archaeon]
MRGKKSYILIFLVLFIILLNFQSVLSEGTDYVQREKAILEKVRQTFWDFIGHPITNIIFGKPTESVSALKQSYGAEYQTLMTVSGFIIHFIILLAIIFIFSFIFEILLPYSYKIFPWFFGIAVGVFIGNLNFISALSSTFGEMGKFFGIWFIPLWVFLLFAIFVLIITGGNSLKSAILVKRLQIEGSLKASKMAKKLSDNSRPFFSFLFILILIFSFLISNVHALDSTPQLPLGINQENIEKAGGIIEGASDEQAASDYLKKEWAKIFEKFPIIQWIDSFLKSISVVLAFIFSEPYTPSFIFFFFIFMWFYFFFKISEMLYDFFPFSLFSSLIIGFLLNFFLGHFGIIRAVVNAFDWLISTLKGWKISGIFVYILVAVILFLFYALTSMLGKIYKKEKLKSYKSVKEAEAGVAAGVIKRVFLKKSY